LDNSASISYIKVLISKGIAMGSEKVFGLLVVSLLASQAIADQTTTKTGASDSGMYCQNNSCKGHSACMGHGNDSCAGQNTKKDQGWLKASNAKECKAAGGKWVKDKKS
jgi:hypothetical protein